VAKLAGISPAIVERAKENLKDLEKNKTSFSQNKGENLFVPIAPAKDPHYEKIKTMIESYDINSMTPLQALQLLAKVKEEI
jgi:DNA mismatch repair ATPase MutS